MAIGSARKFAAQTKGKPRGNGHNTTSRKANAAGYAKRASRRAKTSTLGVEDVYDYAPSFRGTKRANVSLSLDKDEEDNFDRGEGGAQGEDADEEEERREKMRPRLIGEGEEKEMIDEDDDEEIDSDAAFEESDEERFAGFKFPVGKNAKRKDKLPSKSVRFAQVDLNEDDDGALGEEESTNSSQQESEEEEEEGEDDEFIDLLDILDGKGEPDLADDAAASKPSTEETPLSASKEQRTSSKSLHEDVDNDMSDASLGSKGGEEDESEGEDDDDSDEDEDDEGLHVSASDDEDPDGDAIANLDNFISKLEGGTKRKADDSNAGGSGVASDPRPRKKRIVHERTEGGVEGEFGTRASGSTKLSLDDLLTPLATSSTVLTSLKKSTKVLTSSSEKNKPLPAPLPQRSQERVDREAAYEQTKNEVDKWNDTIKRIKEAEHISFPLQQQSLGKPSNLELAAKFKPTTELETAVDKLLKSAKLREEDITRTEDLKMNHLSVEEVANRRAELRKMRDLMFRAEVKARRVAKIKSKTYRRIQKKAKAREGPAAAGEDEEEEGDEARMKREVERARERATLKHKNTGKWAKQMKARGELDEDQRRDVNEMLERGEKLRRRIRGEGSEDGHSGEGSDSGSDEDGDEDGEDGVLKIKKSAFDELEKVRVGGMVGMDGNGSDADGTPKTKAKSVFEMKFMKDAAARQDQQVDKDIDDFRREMGVVEDNDGDEATEEERDGPDVAVERVGGRVTFRPGAAVGASTRVPLPMQSASQLSDTSTLKSSPPLASPLASTHDRPMPPPPSLLSSRSATQKEPAKENPWLAIAAGEGPSTSKIARKRNEVVVGKDSSGAEKSAHALVKSMKKTEAEREKESEDAAVDLDMDDVLLLEPPTGKAVEGAKVKSRREKTRKKKKGKGAKDGEKAVDVDDEDSNSEVEAQEAIASGGKPPRILAFQQRDLVARAFAGDNVVREFEEAKRREIESDAPRDEDTTLAGWGAWGGAGTKKAKPKPHLIKRIPGIAPTARADAGKAHIIISEKRDKKAAKYVVRDLPYPYTSKAQFERSMETPIGVEWNTRVGFQRATVPRVVKKMGTIIDPIEKIG